MLVNQNKVCIFVSTTTQVKATKNLTNKSCEKFARLKKVSYLWKTNKLLI